jgi:hypothetical protein
MPRVAETDPAKLAERKLRKRQRHTQYMQQWRQSSKEVAHEMRGLLEAAAAGEPLKPLEDPATKHGAIQRSAIAALNLALQAHGITVNRILRTISEGLDAEKVKALLGIERSFPDMPQRLRSADIALGLLARAGAIPADHQSEPAAPITINMLVMGNGDAVQSMPLVAKTLTAPALPHRQRDVGTGSVAHEAKLKRNKPYELPEAAEVSGK